MSDITGYLASAVILISFFFGDMKKLRMINTVGCVLFVIYGILLHYSWPVIITNTSIAAINVYHLFKKS